MMHLITNMMNEQILFQSKNLIFVLIEVDFSQLNITSLICAFAYMTNQKITKAIEKEDYPFHFFGQKTTVSWLENKNLEST